MTVSSTTVKSTASGDGSTTQFAYTFKIFANTDLEVIIRSATGTETVKLLTTHYTVAGVGDASGGSITFTSGNTPASGETVVIRREVPQTQAIDYIANDPFPAESHEEGLDRATMTIQQMQEELDRSFKVSSTNSITTPEFTDDAATRASKTLGFDETGQILTTVADFLPAGGDSAMFQYSTTTADADPGAGKFRLNNATISSATIMYIDDLEFNGTDVAAWIQSWDDVVGNDTNRGRIRISKANTLNTWMVFKITGVITDATGYSKINLVYIDSAGTFANDDKTFISFVASGEDGTIPGYFYKFDTSTTDGDPGAGEVRFNNGTYASATAIFIDDADANGVTVSADVLTWDDSTSTIRGYLMIYDINDRSTYARFKITGASTDASGYVKLAVAHLASNNTFSAADELSITFVRNRDSGDTGATGSQGIKGVNGLAMTFSNSTSDADPGAGKVAFNNGTVSSVSVLFIDDVDDAGVNVSTFVQSWDDIVNATARGIITIRKESTPTTFATFKVTGAVTNASGYSKVAVTHIVSSGSFSNADGIGVEFVYSGTDGSGITDVVSDTSPQLGGSLDTNDKTISTVSNRDLELAPNGTGHVTVKGNTNAGSIQFNCESNSHGQIVKSQPHSASVTNTMLLPAGASSTLVSLVSTDTLTNKTLTSPKINEDVAVTSTATEINKLDALSRGSLIYGNASAATAILTKGGANTVLTSDGTDIAWSAAAEGGISWQSSIVTASTITVVANRGYWINTTSNACTITLPSSASVGDELIFTDYLRTWGTNAVTINQNSLKFQGNTSPNPVYNTNGQSINLVYSGATNGWIPNSDDDVTFETPQTYSVDFLVIAGGGGAGGQYYSAGSGAGGYRTSSGTSGGGGSAESSLTFNPGVSYTVTIGAGGAGGVGENAGVSGVNSSLSGSDITTITSVGGGRSSPGLVGTAGGSGGGGGFTASANKAGGAGTSNQGYAGGLGLLGAAASGRPAGGGGAGAVGVSGTANTNGGNGGVGVANSLTGSAVTRAGGGGGSSYQHTSGTGGTGGGGNGGNNGTSTAAQSGTVNTGSGAGGGSHSAAPNGGTGGSGVVILSMPDASYSGTVSGSPTVATGVSGKTVLTFTGSGTYTG